MIRRILHTGFLATLLVGSFSLSGCDDPFVDPFDNPGRYYTIWGHLDPAADVQTVRVIPVTRHAEVIEGPGDTQASIDARVFSYDLNNGGPPIEWQHSLERLSDGTYAHIFRSSRINVRQAGRYRLEVQRSDGKVAWAETRAPDFTPLTTVELGEPYLDTDGHWKRVATLIGMPSPWGIRATYLAEGGTKKRVVWVDYGRSGQRTPSGDWTFVIDLTADMVPLLANVVEGFEAGEIPGRDESGNITLFGLTQMGVRLMLLNEEWDLPDGELDPEYFSRPDVLTNVTNGYGFWGAASALTQQFAVDRELSDALGWPFLQ